MTMAFVMAAVALVAQPDSVDSFYKEFAQRRADISTLRANYTERTVTPEETFESEGVLIYAKPRRIVRRMAPPENTTLIVDDRRVYQYEPEIKQLVVYRLDDDPRANLLFLGFDSDMDALREAYQVSVFSVEDQASGKKGILIQPKPGDTEAWFKEVNLYLDDKDLLPYRIRMVNDDDSQVIIEVRDLKKNPALDPSETQAMIAEGTKVIEDDKVVETVAAGGKLVPGNLADAAQAAPATPEVPAAPLVEVKPLDGTAPPPHAGSPQAVTTRIILASQSPRRRALLASLGIDFVVIPWGAEDIDHGHAPAQIVIGKARATRDDLVRRTPDPALIIAADTLVFLGDEVLSKPQDRAEAIDMLRRLSGNTHHVVTGLAIAHTGTGKALEGSETTAVSFRPLTTAEIEAFVDIVNPLDRAGAYTVDGPGSLLVARYEGCFYNVLGLPLVRLDLMLRQIGVELFPLMRAEGAVFL